MKALANLGVDWRLFLAQAVNFLILLFILKRFAYTPMLRFLEERSAKIEKGLKDAENATTKLEEISKKEEAVLKEAQTQARKIVEEALLHAKERDQEHLEKTKGEVKKMITEAETEIQDARDNMLALAKQEMAGLVIQTTEKLLKKKIDIKEDEILIQEKA